MTTEKAMFGATPKREHAMFGAGCFWGVEHRFRQVEGVIDVKAGYSGGSVPGPSYEEVCSGKTGHAEVVLVEFDPDVVSYEELLEAFWAVHDPTTPDRQGPDVGSQYRSVIFYFTEDQNRMARESEAAEQAHLEKKIITEITAAGEFWPAEEHHQRYYEKNGVGGCPR